jgi:hypothetical protein
MRGAEVYDKSRLLGIARVKRGRIARAATAATAEEAVRDS